MDKKKTKIIVIVIIALVVLVVGITLFFILRDNKMAKNNDADKVCEMQYDFDNLGYKLSHINNLKIQDGRILKISSYYFYTCQNKDIYNQLKNESIDNLVEEDEENLTLKFKLGEEDATKDMEGNDQVATYEEFAREFETIGGVCN